jgi:RNA polymerase sigma factor (TIGR02999 family)
MTACAEADTAIANTKATAENAAVTHIETCLDTLRSPSLVHATKRGGSLHRLENPLFVRGGWKPHVAAVFHSNGLIGRMKPPSRPERGDPTVTELLVQWRAGDERALESLIPLVYSELRSLAHYYLRQERADHTLQSTALVHEAYVRLVGKQPPSIQNRSHFFGVAARLMREILVDYARNQRAAKRGGGAPVLALDEIESVAQRVDVDLLLLDDALTELARLDERQSRIVELRYFSGLSIEETSEVLGISPTTVSREWTTARAWLYREIARSASSSPEA